MLINSPRVLDNFLKIYLENISSFSDTHFRQLNKTRRGEFLKTY
jgi:hypothetical protein